MIKKQYDKAEVYIAENRTEMGNQAAEDAGECIRGLLNSQKYINCIFAAAPSQSDFIEELLKQNIPWEKINVFHLDEYIGLPEDSPNTFKSFLDSSIFGKKNFKSINYINGTAPDPQAEADRYAKLLQNNPPDIVFLGIGDNGHIAFNDPPLATFDDPEMVRVVTLNLASRVQQVNDGMYPSLDHVPSVAITLTIPMIMSGEHLFCIVPGERKAEATKQALTGEVDASCPASILRTHNSCKIYLEKTSAAKL